MSWRGATFGLAVAVGFNAALAGWNVARGQPWLAGLQLAVCVGLVAIRLWGNRRIAAARLAEALYAPRPQGVRVHRANGGTLDAELLYVGTEFDPADGPIAWWRITGIMLQPGDRVEVFDMPDFTGIEFQSADGFVP